MATTVPKGSSLPPNLALALQQKTTGKNCMYTCICSYGLSFSLLFCSLSLHPSPPCPFSLSCEGATTPVLVIGKSSQLANHLTSQLKPTTATPTQPSSSSTRASKTSQAGSETSLASLPQGGENPSKQSSNTSVLV